MWVEAYLVIPAQLEFDRKFPLLDLFEQLKFDSLARDLLGLAFIPFLVVSLEMALDEADVQLTDALAARLSTCAVWDDRVGLRSGRTHIFSDSARLHVDGYAVKVVKYVGRVSRGYDIYVDG